ncbi:hypothetical protein NLC35_03315 [Candidatus Aminicenantes bacterium AC-334-K16]|jgi:predicted DNA-binding transcriptional regulator AlpA|nr:hypothetical protein [Candidatus Aminicenantes bacterium AC-334-K16]
MDPDNNRPKRIIGLKAIAEYLNTSPRNIYRWEKELGFPLHRVGGSKGRSVFVEVDELEEWLKKTDLSRRAKEKSKKIFSQIRQRPVVIVIFLLLTLIPLFIYLITSHNSTSANPVTYEIFGKMVKLKNYRGETLWSLQAWHELIIKETWDLNHRISLADIDGDGLNEVIASPYHPENNQYTLTLFDHNGKAIWSKTIKVNISFQGLRFIKDFIPIRNIFCRRQDDSWVIVTAWRHNVRFVSIIMTLTPKGQIINEFINPGHLSRIIVCDLDSDGEKEILFSGTHNLLNGEGVLVVLPLVGYSGITPPNRIEPEYKYRADFLKRYIADNTPLGEPQACLRFRKPPYFKKLIQTYAFANIESFSENRLSVYFYPWNELPHVTSLGFLFVFDSNLKIMDVIPESLFLHKYNNLSLSNSHLPTLNELTEAAAKNVLRWVQDHWEPVHRIVSK